MIRILLIAILATMLLGAGADPPGTQVIVAFTHLRFEPATIELHRGARVTFHNMDAGAEVYTVVAADGSFESRPLARGAEWSYRFATSGTFEYFLKEHPETKGTAVVE